MQGRTPRASFGGTSSGGCFGRLFCAQSFARLVCVRSDMLLIGTCFSPGLTPCRSRAPRVPPAASQRRLLDQILGDTVSGQAESRQAQHGQSSGTGEYAPAAVHLDEVTIFPDHDCETMRRPINVQGAEGLGNIPEQRTVCGRRSRHPCLQLGK